MSDRVITVRTSRTHHTKAVPLRCPGGFTLRSPVGEVDTDSTKPAKNIRIIGLTATGARDVLSEKQWYDVIFLADD